MYGSPETTTISRKRRWCMNNLRAVFSRRFGRTIIAVLILQLCLAGASAQQALTWDQVKTKFEAANPALQADQSNVDELKAEEITAFLRPNPEFTLSADGTQIAPHEGYWRPTSGTQVQPNFSYLHERDHKRELRLETAKESTHIGGSLHEDLERNLLLACAPPLCRRWRPRRCWNWRAPTSTTTTRSSPSARTASRPAIWHRSIWTASNC